MINLSKEQYKMLLKIKKSNKLPTSSLTEKELEICTFLMYKHCITSRLFSCPDITGVNHTLEKLPKELTITQTGEAEIYVFRSTFYKWWIPVVISVLALLVSIVVPIVQALT